MDFTFATVDVKTLVVDLLKEYLPKYGYDRVRVLRSDPAEQAEIPCIGVNRATDDESNQSIGDHHGVHYNAQTQQYVTYQGTFFSEAVELRIWHTNADERDALYYALKGVMFGIRTLLVGKGLLDVQLSGGRDEQDSTMENAPCVLYWSTMTLTYLNPLNVEIVDIVAPISSVTDNGGINYG